MNTFRTLFRSFATALAAAAMLAPAPGYAFADSGLAAPSARGPQVHTGGEALLVQSGGCYAIGQRVAAQHGGTVARADPASRGGQQVCVIVVVIPAKDGQRGRRLEFVVPQG